MTKTTTSFRNFDFHRLTPILRDRIVGEYELSRGNGMNHETAVAHVLITVPVAHDKILEVLKSR